MKQKKHSPQITIINDLLPCKLEPKIIFEVDSMSFASSTTSSDSALELSFGNDLELQDEAAVLNLWQKLSEGLERFCAREKDCKQQ